MPKTNAWALRAVVVEPPPAPPPASQDRVQTSFEYDNWAKNDDRYKDMTPPGQVNNTDVGWYWASRGPRGLWAPWDPDLRYVFREPGTRVVQLESVDTVAVGDRVSFQGNSTVYVLVAVDSVAKTVTLDKNVPSPILSRALMTRGGNWLDRDGAVRGTNHFFSQVVSTLVVTVDISEIDGDIFIPFPIRIASVKIDGQPARAFSNSVGVAGGQGLPTPSGGNTFVSNRTVRGSSMELTRTSTATQTLTVDKLAGPLIKDYSQWNPADTVVNPADHFEFEVTSEAAVRGVFGVDEPFASTTHTPQFIVEPNGLRSIRFTFTTGQPRGIKWDRGVTFTSFPQWDPSYWQFTWMFEEDVWLHHDDGGTKMPRFSSEMAFHSGPSKANPNMFGIEDYLGGKEQTDVNATGITPEQATAQGFGRSPFGVIFKAGVWYTMEFFRKINTPGLKDGHRSIWVNGYRILHLEDYDWYGTATPPATTSSEFMFFHGGQSTPTGPCTYRFAKVRIGSQYIGKPPELAAPAWIPPAGQIGIVPQVGTLAAVNPCPANNCIYSGGGGYTTGQNGIFTESGSVYASDWGRYGGIVKTGGGHSNYGGNEVYVFDLEALSYIRLDSPSTSPSVDLSFLGANYNTGYYGAWAEHDDGQPCSMHAYGRHLYLPPGVGGAGPKGAVLRAAGGLFVATNKATHVFDLNNPSARWTRWASALPGGFSHHVVVSCCHDSTRNRIWVTGQGQEIWYFNVADRSFINEIDLLANGWSPGGGSTSCGSLFYFPTLDRIVWWNARLRSDNNLEPTAWMLRDMSNPGLGFTHVGFNFTGDPLPNYPNGSRLGQYDINMAGDGKLYLVTPADAAIFQITLPATPEGTWQIVRMPYTSLTSDQAVIDAWNAARTWNGNDSPTGGGGLGKHQRNFSWCSKLGCFVWPYRATVSPLSFTPPA